MKVLHRIFSILLIAGMMLGWTTSGSILAQSTEPAQPQVNAIDKFDAQVLEELNAGNADFFVTLTEQADVSYADQLQTKAEKGQYVYETLVATAERTQSALRGLLDSQGVNYRSYYILNAILVKAGSLELATSIANRSDVATITANYRYQVDEPIIEKELTVKPSTIEPNLTFIKADQVWALGITGQGTVMAGNDTGLDVTHPAIARHYRGCLNPPSCTSMDHNYNWYDVWDPGNVVPWDDYGHGTHTTGTMVGDDGGANQIGVAPGATTVHCKNMVGGGGDSEHFVACFEWDLAPWDLSGQNPRPDLAPDAINNSWGFPGGGDNSMRTAVLNLQAGGIVVEVSAGNEGASCQSLRSPGDYFEVVTTGSVNHAAPFPGTITGFSSRGPSDLDPTPPNYFPDVMAPGENIRSALPGNQYDYWGGTSMAGPHVTALVGLIWSANPALQGQVNQTIDIIRDTAAPLTGQNGSNCGGDYTTGPNNDWGFGTIDALAAVQYAIAMGGAGKLDGTVTDSSTGDPIEGVDIHAEHEDGFAWNDLTDASGYYTMTVAAGLFDITATKFGYLTGVATGVEVLTDTTTTQNFALVPATSYTISGYVREAGSNAPLDAVVEFLDAPVAPVNTDPATGFYSVDMIEGTWTMRASAADHAPDTAVVTVAGNTQQDFSLSLFCAVLEDDVENGNIGWTAQAPWGIVTEASHSPTHSWTDSPGGYYQNYVDTSLTSPVIDLTDYTGMSLSWWQTYATESNYDYARVEYSTNGGSSWTEAVNYDGTNMTWTQEATPLPDLDGQANARIRFHFTSDVSITYDGWHIDDIALIGGGPGCLPPAALAIDPPTQELTGDPGTTVTFDYTVTNVGTVAQDVLLDVAAELGWLTTVDPTDLGTLGAGESAVATVSVTIPTDLDSLSDTFTLTANGSEGTFATATGTTWANVHPGVAVVIPADGHGWPLRLVSYEFTVTNTGDYTDSFALDASGIWSATLPGGANTGPLAPGASATVVVLVEVFEGASAGDTDVTTLTVTSDLDPTAFVEATVTTMASYAGSLPIIVK